MTNRTTAEFCALTRYLGLTQTELGELARAPLTAVRAWLKGETLPPPPVFEALDALSDDIAGEITRLAELGRKTGEIPVTRSTESLRALAGEDGELWRPPPRGQAAGAFAGPQQIAALAAGFEVEDAKSGRPTLVWHPS